MKFLDYNNGLWRTRRLCDRAGGVTCLIVLVIAGLGSVATAKPGKAVVSRDYLQRSARAGVLRDGKVVFSGTRISIPVVAVAPNAPDTTFEVHGQVNPTLVVPAGAKIRFELVNADKGMPHGLDVTVKGPPYAVNPHLPMRKTPQKAPVKTTTIVSQQAKISVGVVPNAGHGRMPVKKSVWFTLGPGEYHYVCPVPGHAKAGMHGLIIVQQDKP